MTRSPPEFHGELEALAAEDPRLDTEYVRLIDDADRPVVLVGVVHDHPASVHRARRVVEALDPDVVALELPDAVTPLVDGPGRNAGGGRRATEDGGSAESSDAGEMSAAVEAAATDDVVGVDVPGRGTLAALAREFAAERPDAGTAGRALAGLGRIVAHTARGWLRTLGVPDRLVGDAFEHTQEYDCSADEPADAQATHEAAHLRRSTSLMRAFERPPATRVLDRVRERVMARRLAALRESSSVVAVLGFSHLDGVERGVRGRD